ncbi:MAG: hypothetical protein ABI598_04945 [Chloroflexota bacterium]
MDIHDERSPDPAVPPTSRTTAFEERAESLGRDAEGAARRFAANPAVRSASDFGARAWGLVLLAVGLWLFAQITLRLDLPDVAWADLWPAGLIVIGLIVLLGSGRRR